MTPVLKQIAGALEIVLQSYGQAGGPNAGSRLIPNTITKKDQDSDHSELRSLDRDDSVNPDFYGSYNRTLWRVLRSSDQRPE